MTLAPASEVDGDKSGEAIDDERYATKRTRLDEQDEHHRHDLGHSMTRTNLLTQVVLKGLARPLNSRHRASDARSIVL